MGFSAAGQIRPRRHQNHSTWHGKSVIPKVQNKGQSQTAPCRIACHNDFLCSIMAFLQKPAISSHRISQSRRKRKPGRNPVVHRQHIASQTPPGILHGKIPIRVFHGTNIASPMKLQNHSACKNTGGPKIFHLTVPQLNNLIIVICRADPGRLHRICPVFSCLKLMSHGRVHHIFHHVPHHLAPQTDFFFSHPFTCCLSYLFCLSLQSL